MLFCCRLVCPLPTALTASFFTSHWAIFFCTISRHSLPMLANGRGVRRQHNKATTSFSLYRRSWVDRLESGMADQALVSWSTTKDYRIGNLASVYLIYSNFSERCCKHGRRCTLFVEILLILLSGHANLVRRHLKENTCKYELLSRNIHVWISWKNTINASLTTI